MARLKIIAVTLGLLMVLLMAGFSLATFMFSSAFEVAVPATPTSPAESVNNETMRGNASIATLVASSTDSIECAIAFSDREGGETGTVFIAEGQVRVDILKTSTVVESSVVVGANRIAWSYDVATGSTTARAFESAVVETPVAYTCVPWEIDRSVFVLPE